jgi:hypothetical protein
MDDIVKAALKKWPNVPHAYGWLGLDGRGDWYLRDEQVQAGGAFERARGSRIEHEKLREFIARNYEHDERGCWFFQNGPQRVYVELQAAPWVLRTDGRTAQTHTGLTVTVRDTFVDEAGRLFAGTDLGLALVHTQDMHAALQALETGTWPAPQEAAFGSLPERFGYRMSPQALAGA